MACKLISVTREGGKIIYLDGGEPNTLPPQVAETTETGEVLDTITVQALINRYPTVCGMTGTALAAGEQLRQFYKLGVSPIPPNTPNVREDEPDRIYITAGAKNDAIVDHIIEVHATGQPILVGTQDVAESEDLHARLVRRGETPEDRKVSWRLDADPQRNSLRLLPSGPDRVGEGYARRQSPSPISLDRAPVARDPRRVRAQSDGW